MLANIMGGPAGFVIDKTPDGLGERNPHCSVLRNSMKSWI